MPFLLRDCQSFPDRWRRRLAPYGYETAEQFISSCFVPGGLEALARAVGVDEQEVILVQEAVLAVWTPTTSVKPLDMPLGAVDSEGD